MLRMLGLLLLAIGTGLAAVYGAWLPGSERPDHRARMAAEAHAAMSQVVGKELAQAGAAHDAAARPTPAQPSPAVARLNRLAALPAPVAPLDPDGKILAPPRGGDSVSLWAEEAGAPFGLGVLLVVIGVVLARRGMHAESLVAQAHSVSTGAAPGPLLARLVQELDTLCARYGEAPAGSDVDINMEAVRADVERLQHEVVNPLVEGREQISQAFGVGTYADIFVPFSAAERQLNRVWSACVDGYIDEISPCLQRAQVSALQAHEAFGVARSSQSS